MKFRDIFLMARKRVLTLTKNSKDFTTNDVYDALEAAVGDKVFVPKTTTAEFVHYLMQQKLGEDYAYNDETEQYSRTKAPVKKVVKSCVSKAVGEPKPVKPMVTYAYNFLQNRAVTPDGRVALNKEYVDKIGTKDGYNVYFEYVGNIVRVFAGTNSSNTRQARTIDCYGAVKVPKPNNYKGNGVRISLVEVVDDENYIEIASI